MLSASGMVGCAAPATGRLEGFDVSRHWNEQTTEYAHDPGVRIHINAPSEAELDPAKPTLLVLYPLPNGNTIEWTIGRARADGLDWHYDIQHIGAQTRRLREVIHDENIVVAYLEAEGRSWPAWRRTHDRSSELIVAVIDRVRRQVGLPDTRLALSGHSGGGSFVFGYLNAFEHIPDDVVRITFLDSNYGFAASEGHGSKLLDWIGRDQNHYLVVLAYDDREIVFNGQKVVGPTGGTYRATGRMLDVFSGTVELTKRVSGDCTRWRGLGGRIDIMVHENPDNRILHTALVGDMNGFIHAMTAGTAFEDKAGRFGGPVAYDKWIQPD